MIDWERVRELQSEIGPDDFDEVVVLFIEEADDVVGRLDRAASAKEMESHLHFLKGSALNLGFSDLAGLCQTEERRAAQGATDVPLDRVREVYLASRQVFLRDLAGQLAA